MPPPEKYMVLYVRISNAKVEAAYHARTLGQVDGESIPAPTDFNADDHPPIDINIHGPRDGNDPPCRYVMTASGWRMVCQ